jgi:hypothetical protein
VGPGITGQALVAASRRITVWPVAGGHVGPGITGAAARASKNIFENQSKVLLVSGNNILNEGASIGCIHRSFHEEAHHIAKA